MSSDETRPEPDERCLAGDHQTRRMSSSEAYPATDGVACDRCGRYLLSWGVEWTRTPERWTPQGILPTRGTSASDDVQPRSIDGIRTRALAWRDKLTGGGTDSISAHAALGMLADVESLLAHLDRSTAQEKEPRCHVCKVAPGEDHEGYCSVGPTVFIPNDWVKRLAIPAGDSPTERMRAAGFQVTVGTSEGRPPVDAYTLDRTEVSPIDLETEAQGLDRPLSVLLWRVREDEDFPVITKGGAVDQVLDIIRPLLARAAAALAAERKRAGAAEDRAGEALHATLLRPSSDRLAAACLREIDRGNIDARSEIGDALLDWCGVRTDARGDEINAFRRVLALEDPSER